MKPWLEGLRKAGHPGGGGGLGYPRGCWGSLGLGKTGVGISGSRRWVRVFPGVPGPGLEADEPPRGPFRCAATTWLPPFPPFS